jgi:hypothetical protein
MKVKLFVLRNELLTISKLKLELLKKDQVQSPVLLLFLGIGHNYLTIKPNLDHPPISLRSGKYKIIYEWWISLCLLL